LLQAAPRFIRRRRRFIPWRVTLFPWSATRFSARGHGGGEAHHTSCRVGDALSVASDADSVERHAFSVVTAPFCPWRRPRLVAGLPSADATSQFKPAGRGIDNRVRRFSLLFRAVADRQHELAVSIQSDKRAVTKPKDIVNSLRPLFPPLGE
jgi:hypothetical protein